MKCHKRIIELFRYRYKNQFLLNRLNKLSLICDENGEEIQYYHFSLKFVYNKEIQTKTKYSTHLIRNFEKRKTPIRSIVLNK
jgi:hypothetical protein